MSNGSDIKTIMDNKKTAAPAPQRPAQTQQRPAPAPQRPAPTQQPRPAPAPAQQQRTVPAQQKPVQQQRPVPAPAPQRPAPAPTQQQRPAPAPTQQRPAPAPTQQQRPAPAPTQQQRPAPAPAQQQRTAQQRPAQTQQRTVPAQQKPVQQQKPAQQKPAPAKTEKRLSFINTPEQDYGTKEAFNSLRTNIRFCGDNIKTIMMTSCQENEGKTSTAINYAISLAADGKKVIIVDCDLRKSVIVGRYRLEAEGEIVGLTHYLSGQVSREDVIYKTNYKNFDIILAGHETPNPTELLGSDAFAHLLEELRSTYDAVIIDSPPLGAVIDTAVITKECDGIVLVIEANAVSYRFAQDVKKQIDMTECRLLGVVLNKVPDEGNGYYYNRYQKGYRKGYYK